MRTAVLETVPHLPLLFLQHFTGTLDNWDPAVTDPLASGREVILFDNAGVGRSSGTVPETVAGMAQHTFSALSFWAGGIPLLPEEGWLRH